MFAREAKILQLLSYLNIARVLDHFVENDRNYLLLEHINGLDLRDYIKEHGPQPERLIMRWVFELADVLAYLHEQSPPIVHRDVTPDNVVLDRTGSIKLIDFGAANQLLTTATGTLVGKQPYTLRRNSLGARQSCRGYLFSWLYHVLSCVWKRS